MTILYKSSTGSNFRQIVKIDKVDVCGVIANVNTFPGLKDMLYWANATMPGLIKKCPYKDVSKSFRTYDVTSFLVKCFNDKYNHKEMA